MLLRQQEHSGKRPRIGCATIDDEVVQETPLPDTAIAEPLRFPAYTKKQNGYPRL